MTTLRSARKTRFDPHRGSTVAGTTEPWSAVSMFEIVNRVLAWHNSRNRDRGASAVEYALILFAIAAAAAAIDLGVTVHVDQSCPTPVDTTQDAQVTVRYTFTFVTPFGSLAALLGGSAPKGTVVLTGRALTACQ